MNIALRKHFDNIRPADARAQNAAFLSILKATDRPVNWAHEVWDELLGMLTDKDNCVWAIIAQRL